MLKQVFTLLGQVILPLVTKQKELQLNKHIFIKKEVVYVKKYQIITNNENFTVKLNTDYSDLITFSVYDTRGRVLQSSNVTKTNSLGYIYNLNMSNAEAGIYFIRLGNSTVGYKTGRIIVK